MIELSVTRQRGHIEAWLDWLNAPTTGIAAASAIVEQSVRQNIEQRRDPSGRPWRELSRVTLELRERGVDRGPRGSTLGAVGSRIEQGGRRGVVSVRGAAAMHARIQQLGIRRGSMKVLGKPAPRASLPARQFMPSAQTPPNALLAEVKRGFVEALRAHLASR